MLKTPRCRYCDDYCLECEEELALTHVLNLVKDALTLRHDILLRILEMAVVDGRVAQVVQNHLMFGRVLRSYRRSLIDVVTTSITFSARHPV